MRNAGVLSVTAAAILSACGTPAQAQPHQPPPPVDSVQDDTRDAQPEHLRAVMRQAAERQLQQLRERSQRLERALRLLDEGKSLAEVREAMPRPPEGQGRPLRDGMRPAGGTPDMPPGDEPDGPRDTPFEQALNRSGGPIDQLDRPLPDGPQGQGGQGPRGGRARPDGQENGRPDRRNPQGPGGAEGQRPGPPGQAAPELGEREQTFLDEFLRSSAPAALERFEELRRRDPEAARERFQQMFPRLRFLYDMREREPRMYELRLKDIRFSREALESARWIAHHEHDADVNIAERDTHMSDLRTALANQFSTRTEILAFELEKTRERTERMTRDIAERPSQSQAAVDKFAEALINRERERKNRPTEADRPFLPGETRPEHRRE